LPGETKVVTFYSAAPASLAELQQQVRIRTLADAF
jgi:hypothetical protein